MPATSRNVRCLKELNTIPPNPPRWDPSSYFSSISRPGLDTTASVNDQIDQIDQLITLNLQDIDVNFSKMQQVLSNRILPFLKRFVIGTELVREATKRTRGIPSALIRLVRNYANSFTHADLTSTSALSAAPMRTPHVTNASRNRGLRRTETDDPNQHRLHTRDKSPLSRACRRSAAKKRRHAHPSRAPSFLPALRDAGSAQRRRLKFPTRRTLVLVSRQRGRHDDGDNDDEDDDSLDADLEPLRLLSGNVQPFARVVVVGVEDDSFDR
ncbi:hypothetical protein V8E53_006189 [Lactarius tabidus]